MFSLRNLIILLFIITVNNNLSYSQIKETINEKEIKAFLDSLEIKLYNMEKKITRNDSNATDNKRLLAKIYFYLGFDLKAKTLLQNLKKNNIDLNVFEKKMLALIYFRMGRLSESLAIFEEVNKSLPNDFQTNYYINNIQKKLNIFNESYNKFQSAYDNFQEEYSRFIQDTNKIMFNGAKNSMLGDENITYRLLKNDTVLSDMIKETIIKKENNDVTTPAIIIIKDENYNILNDNSFIYTEHKMIKLLNEKGKSRYADIEIGFDDAIEYVEIDYIRIYTPDGLIYEIPQEKYVHDVSPWTGSYSHFKQKIITYPQVMINSVIEYKYRKTTFHPLHKDNIQIGISIKENIPIIKSSYKISHPINRELKIKYPVDYKPIVETNNKEKSYYWQINTPIKAIEIEPYMNLSNYAPFITGSFFKNWHEIHDWLNPYYYGNTIKCNKDLQNLVNDLVKDCTYEEEKVKVIYNWINKNIRYIALEYGQGGIYPRNANDTYYNKYGDCKDQSILLTAMLRAAGVNAFPSLIKTASDFDSTIYNLEFNHCITYVELKNKGLFLDVIAKKTPYHNLAAVDQDRLCFILKDNNWEIKRTPLSEPNDNLDKRTMIINIDSTGKIDMTKKTETWGSQNTIYKNYFINLTSEKIKEAVQYDLSYFCPGGVVEKYDILNLDKIDSPFVMIENFIISNWFQNISENSYLMKIPTLYFSFDELTQSQRKYTLNYSTTANKEYIIEINYPNEYKVKKIPADYDFNSNLLKVSYKTKIMKNKISILISYIRKVNKIEVKDYEMYKKEHDNLLNKIIQPIVFIK